MKVSGIVFGFMMSVAIGLVMSFFISFFMLAVSVGFVEGFFLLWMRSFATGFAVALPVGAVAIPLTQRALGAFFRVQE